MPNSNPKEAQGTADIQTKTIFPATRKGKRTRSFLKSWPPLPIQNAFVQELNGSTLAHNWAGVAKLTWCELTKMFHIQHMTDCKRYLGRPAAACLQQSRHSQAD